jgi:hypothetical protein
MLNDREGAARVFAIDLEDDADAGREAAGAAFARLHDLEPGRGRAGSAYRHRAPLPVSSEQICTMNVGGADVNIE